MGKPLVSKEEVKGQSWATWSGVLGSDVSGIWPKYSNLTEINAVDANLSAAVLVTGDDLGLVKLFRFPCHRKGLNSKSLIHILPHIEGLCFYLDIISNLKGLYIYQNLNVTLLLNYFYILKVCVLVKCFFLPSELLITHLNAIAVTGEV